MIKSIRSFLFNIYFYGLTAIYAFFAMLCSFIFSVRIFRKIIWFWTWLVLFGFRWILGARWEVRGHENLPQDGGSPALIVSKHQSEMDAILFIHLFPDFSPIAMQELEKYPFFKHIMRKLDYILVRTDKGPQSRTNKVVEQAKRVNQQGRPILIFPEGTLMSLGARERYRKGVYHIYKGLNKPVHLVALSLGVCWPRREWHKSPGNCAMEFLPPLEVGLEQDVFMREIETRIEEGTISLIREHAPTEIKNIANYRYDNKLNNIDGNTFRLSSKS